MLTPDCSLIIRAASKEQKNVPFKFVSTAQSHFSSVISKKVRPAGDAGIVDQDIRAG
jgi:hypothetical protein